MISESPYIGRHNDPAQRGSYMADSRFAGKRCAQAWTAAVVLGAAIHGQPSFAVDGPVPDKGSSASSDELTSIVVTGSYIRRTDTETPSPLQVISSADIDKAGKVSISDVIRQVSADNSGSLTQNFS